MPTKSTTTTTEAAEAEVTISERAEALDGDVGALAMLAADPAVTATEVTYIMGLMLAADAKTEADTVKGRVQRYSDLGRAVHAMTRVIINTGGAKTTKGTKREVLPSGSTISFADVRDATGVRDAGDKFTLPASTGAAPVGKTELQRYWAAASFTDTAVDRAIAKLAEDGKSTTNAMLVVDEAAKITARDRMTADERVAADKRAAKTEAAKTARGSVADRTKAREAEAREAAEAPMITAEAAEAASLSVLLSTLAVITEAVAKFHTKAEAEAEADTTLAAIAAARGISVDEMRALIDSLTAAKLAEREAAEA